MATSAAISMGGREDRAARAPAQEVDTAVAAAQLGFDYH